MNIYTSKPILKIDRTIYCEGGIAVISVSENMVLFLFRFNGTTRMMYGPHHEIEGMLTRGIEKLIAGDPNFKFLVQAQSILISSADQMVSEFNARSAAVETCVAFSKTEWWFLLGCVILFALGIANLLCLVGVI